MKKIEINTQQKYIVTVGENLWDNIREELLRCNNSKFIVITDSNVWSIYENIFKENLSCFNFETFIITDGEKSKSVENIVKISEFMLERDFCSKDIIIAFGGGVVGDVAGLAASIYMRGVDFIQIPTTLLSAVDSSVGGKNGVNLSGHKKYYRYNKTT